MQCHVTSGMGREKRPQRGRLVRTRLHCQGGTRSQSPPRGQESGEQLCPECGELWWTVRRPGQCGGAEPACRGAVAWPWGRRCEGPAPRVVSSSGAPFTRGPGARERMRDAHCGDRTPAIAPPGANLSRGTASGSRWHLPSAVALLVSCLPARSQVALAGAQCSSCGAIYSCFCGAELQSSRY